MRHGHTALRHLADEADLVTLAPGTVIERAGTKPRQLVGIVTGRVRATTEAGDTRTLGPGDHIGAAELMADRAHDATYTTVTPTTATVVFGPLARTALGPTPHTGEPTMYPHQILFDIVVAEHREAILRASGTPSAAQPLPRQRRRRRPRLRRRFTPTSPITALPVGAP